MEAYWYFDFAFAAFATCNWRRCGVACAPAGHRRADALRALLKSQGTNDRRSTAVTRRFGRAAVNWRAKTAGIPLNLHPATYPFNSVAALRLCTPPAAVWNAIEAIFATCGATAARIDAGRISTPSAATLGITSLGSRGRRFETGNQLRLNTEAARALGVTQGAVRAHRQRVVLRRRHCRANVDEWLARGHVAQSLDLQLRVGWY